MSKAKTLGERLIEGLEELITNPTVDNRTRRKHLRCSIYPPNKGENAKRRPKHGARKPRHKDKRS